MLIKKFEKDNFKMYDLIDLCAESINYCCSKNYSDEQIKYWTEHLIPDIFKEIYKNPENYSGFVSIEENEIAGICFLDLKNSKIKCLYVKPKFLRQKIGQKLMLKIEETAEIKGIKELELDASINAIDFYKSMTYLEIGPTSCSCPSCTVPEIPSLKMKKGLKTQIVQNLTDR